VVGDQCQLETLADLSGTWIDRVHERKPPRSIILDMDSSESPTHGQQEGSAYNGHFGCTYYHPLFVFNQFGDPERCILRPGNVHSAEGLARGARARDRALSRARPRALLPNAGRSPEKHYQMRGAAPKSGVCATSQLARTPRPALSALPCVLELSKIAFGRRHPGNLAVLCPLNLRRSRSAYHEHAGLYCGSFALQDDGRISQPYRP
jgi:hypothetical protein